MSTELPLPSVPRPHFEGGQILTDQWLNRLVDWAEDADRRTARLGGWGIRDGWLLGPGERPSELRIGAGVLVTPAGAVVSPDEPWRVPLADLIDDASNPPAAGEWTATLWLEPRPAAALTDQHMTFRAAAPGMTASTVATALGLVLRLRPAGERPISPFASVELPFPGEIGGATADELRARRLEWLVAYAAARRRFARANRMPVGRLRLTVEPGDDGPRHVLRDVVDHADRPTWGDGFDTDDELLTGTLVASSPAVARRRLEAAGVVVAPDAPAPAGGAAPWRLRLHPGAIARLRVDDAGRLAGLDERHPNLAARLDELASRLDGQDARLDRHWRRMDDLREWAWRFAILWGGVGAAFVLAVVAVALTAGLDDGDLRLVLLVIALAVLAVATLGQRNLLRLLIQRARRRREDEESAL